MELIEGIFARRSCKKYRSDPVPEKEIQTVIEAGIAAASGRNMQAPAVLAIVDPEARNAYSHLNSRYDFAHRPDPFYGAPVILAVLADRSVPTYLYDGSLVLGNMMLAAEALGLGSCWIHRAKEEFESEEGKAILRELGIEGDYEGIGHCILGYADEEPQAAKRKENYIYYVK